MNRMSVCLSLLFCSSIYSYSDSTPGSNFLDYLAFSIQGHPIHDWVISQLLTGANSGDRAIKKDVMGALKKWADKVNKGSTGVINSGRPFHITEHDALRIISQFKRSPMEWGNVPEVVQYSQSIMGDSGAHYWPNDSAKVTVLNSWGNKTRKRYAHNGDWNFDWESSPVIASFDGCVVDTRIPFDFINKGCAYGAHLYTSYIINPQNSMAVLISEYLRYPERYPAITAMLLVMTSTPAPYMKTAGIKNGIGIDNFGYNSGNNTCCSGHNTYTSGRGEAARYHSYPVYDFNAACFVTNGDNAGSIICKYADQNGNCVNQAIATKDMWMKCPCNLDISFENDTHGHFACNFAK